MRHLLVFAQATPLDGTSERIKNLALEIGGSFFIAIVVVGVLAYFFGRQHGKLVVFGAVAFVISLFVFNSEAVVRLMKNTGEYLLGG